MKKGERKRVQDGHKPHESLATSSKPQVAVYRQGEKLPSAGVDHRRTGYSRESPWSEEAKAKEGKVAGIDELNERMEALEEKLARLVDILSDEGL